MSDQLIDEFLAYVRSKHTVHDVSSHYELDPGGHAIEINDKRLKLSLLIVENASPPITSNWHKRQQPASKKLVFTLYWPTERTVVEPETCYILVNNRMVLNDNSRITGEAVSWLRSKGLRLTRKKANTVQAPTAAALPGALIGRKSIKKSIEDCIRAQKGIQIINLWGECGVGKTFLLDRVSKEMTDSIVPIHVEAPQVFQDDSGDAELTMSLGLLGLVDNAAEAMGISTTVKGAPVAAVAGVLPIAALTLALALARKRLPPEKLRGFWKYLTSEKVKGNLTNSFPYVSQVLDFFGIRWPLEPRPGDDKNQPFNHDKFRKSIKEATKLLLLAANKRCPDEQFPKKRVCIFLNSCGPNDAVVDKWLKEYVLAEPLASQLEPVIILARRSSEGFADLYRSYAQRSIQLHNFTHDEAQQLLTQCDEPVEKKNVWQQNSHCSPLLLSLLCNPATRDKAVFRFTEQLLGEADPNIHDAIIDLSMAKLFSGETIRRLFPDQFETIFDSVKRLSFCRITHDRWQYQDVARETLISRLRLERPSREAEAKTTLTAYSVHGERRFRFMPNDDSVRIRTIIPFQAERRFRSCRTVGRWTVSRPILRARSCPACASFLPSNQYS
jgi:hypothetical protein